MPYSILPEKRVITKLIARKAMGKPLMPHKTLLKFHLLMPINVIHRKCYILLLSFCGYVVPLHSQSVADSSARIIDSSVQVNEAKTPANALSEVDSLPQTQKVAPHLYKMNYWVTIGISALATAGNLYAIPKMLHNKKGLSAEEIQAANPNIFNGIDRWALQQDPSKRSSFQQSSDLVLPIVAIASAAIVLDKRVKTDWLRVLLMYYEMHAVTFSIYNFSPFGPAFQNKFRPLVYYNQIPYTDRMGEGNRNSFYSGHTASVTASTFFAVKVYSDYHPEIGNKKYLLYGLATIPPIVEGYLRLKALAHFPSDIMVGYIIGAVTGITVPELHRYKKQVVRFGMTYSPAGPQLSMIWRLGQREKKLHNTFVNLPTNMAR